MIKNNLTLVLKIQLMYLILCILWNSVGLWRISLGEQAIGPTASVGIIALLLSFMLMLSVCHYKKWRILYLIFSLIIFLLAVSSVVGAFVKPPSLWPSDILRFSGVVLNLLGILSFVILIQHWKSSSMNRV